MIKIHSCGVWPSMSAVVETVLVLPCPPAEACCGDFDDDERGAPCAPTEPTINPRDLAECDDAE